MKDSIQPSCSPRIHSGILWWRLLTGLEDHGLLEQNSNLEENAWLVFYKKTFNRNLWLAKSISKLTSEKCRFWEHIEILPGRSHTSRQREDSYGIPPLMSAPVWKYLINTNIHKKKYFLWYTEVNSREGGEVMLKGGDSCVPMLRLNMFCCRMLDWCLWQVHSHLTQTRDNIYLKLPMENEVRDQFRK